MTITIANVSTTTDTFGQWVTKTNIIADALTNKIVTTNSNTAVGNAAVSNAFTANVLYANTISGGNTGTTSVLTMTSNVDFSANATFKGVRVNLGLPANVAIQGGNSTNRVLTVNSAASNTLAVTQLLLTDISDFNVTSPANGQFLVYNSTSSKWENTNSANSFNTVDLTVSNSVTIGNSSVNTIANSTSMLVATGRFGNTTVNTSVNSTAIYMGNSTTNTTITSSLITVNNISFSSNGALTLPYGNTDSRPGTATNGMIRYNTSNNSFEGYANGAWGAIAGSGGAGSLNIIRQSYTANSTVNTVFTVTNGYLTNQADVYQNGVKLVNGTDVSLSSGSTFTLTTPALLNDVIDFVGYQTLPGNTSFVSFSAVANSSVNNNFTVPNGYSNTTIIVFVNGIKQKNGTDVNVSDNSTLVFPANLANGAIVEAIGTQTYSGTSYLSKTGDSATGDYTFSGNTTVNNFAVSRTATFSGNVTIGGNLTVTGTAVYLNTTTLTVNDNIITLNSGVSGSPSLNAGLEVNRGTSQNSAIRWNESSGYWELAPNTSSFSRIVDVSGATFSGNVIPSANGGYLGNTASRWAVYANTVDVTSKVQIGAAAGYDFGTLAVIEIDTSANSYQQIVIQNANTGTNASGDLVITADNGNDSVNFVDFGINSSNYNQSAFSITAAGDAYLYTSNSSLAIGAAAAAKEVIFHAGGTTSADRKLHVNATSIGVNTGIQIISLGAGRATPYSQTYNSSVALDLSQRNHFEMTLTGAVTLANPTNINAGQSGVIKVVQDSTGGRTIAFGTYWKFQDGATPSLTTTANAVDLLAYYVTNSTYIATSFISNVS